MTATYEERAKQHHDRLIELGGRPTRPVRLQPTWNATYRDGLIYITDNEGELESTLSDDIDPMNHHWSTESAQFGRELENWQRFREYQQSLQHLDRVETELELDNTDAGLISVLTRLSDWEEFELFQDLIGVDAFNFEDRRRLRLLQITKCEVPVENSLPSSAAHEAIRTWLRLFNRSQEEIEDAENQLNWIKGQWPELIAESVDSLSKTPELQLALEAKFRKQTQSTVSAIQKLGGRPSHTVSPPDHSMDSLHRILYWTSETSKYKKELLDWKMFLKWRRRNLRDKPQEYRCLQFQSALDFPMEFEEFRLFQCNVTSTWLQCWQRLVKWYEEEIKTPHPDFTYGNLDDHAEVARSHMRDSETKLAEATKRFEKAKQEHAYTLADHGQSTGGEIGIEYPQTPFPPTPPPSDPQSPQSSRSSYSSQVSPSSPSPPSSRSSQSSQSSQSPEHLFKDQRPLSKRSSTEQGHRRSKKQKARKKGSGGAKMDNTKQRTLPKFSSDPFQVGKDDDIQMTDAHALGDLTPVEIMDDFEEAESEDLVMTDFENPPTHISSCSPDARSRPATSTDFGKLSLCNAQGSTSRKTRSATKLNQALSGRVLKNTDEKPTKKAKEFTEQQTIMLLNAASNEYSPPDSPPLRRSERLKEKAAAPAVTSPPELNATQSFHSSGQKHPQKEFNLVEPSRASRHKKPKIQPNSFEPSQTSMQKKPNIQSNTIKPPRSSRQKKLEKRARDSARPG